MFDNTCSVAQRKRVGLITQRSMDRNHLEQTILAFFPLINTLGGKLVEDVYNVTYMVLTTSIVTNGPYAW